MVGGGVLGNRLASSKVSLELCATVTSEKCRVVSGARKLSDCRTHVAVEGRGMFRSSTCSVPGLSQSWVTLYILKGT